MDLTHVAAEAPTTQATLDRMNRMQIEVGDTHTAIIVLRPEGQAGVLERADIANSDSERRAKMLATRWKIPRQNIIMVL